MNTKPSTRLESNPFFTVDIDRWGQRYTLRLWLEAVSYQSREWFCNPVGVCEHCGGEQWASVTRPVVCWTCYENGNALNRKNNKEVAA